MPCHLFWKWKEEELEVNEILIACAEIRIAHKTHDNTGYCIWWDIFSQLTYSVVTNIGEKGVVVVLSLANKA